jgi:anti-sigma factor RsiW
VTHRRAARLLTALLDGGLTPGLRRAVREHARECPFCRRRLREHRGVEVLVRLLPHSLLPVEPSRGAQLRLWGLARWFVDPVAAAQERTRISAVGVCAFALAAVLAVTVSAWTPFGDEAAGLLVLAQATPDVTSMVPLGWR